MKKEKSFIQLVVSQKSGVSDDVDQVIEETLELFKRGKTPQEKGQRRYERWSVNLMGVAQFFLVDTSVIYLPVMIRNMSKSGILLEFVEKGYLHERMLHEIQEFNLLFIPPHQRDVVTVVCHPRRIELNRSVLIGASFCLVPNSDEGSPFLM